MDVLGNGLGVHEVVSTAGGALVLSFLHTFHGNRDRGTGRVAATNATLAYLVGGLIATGAGGMLGR